MMKEEENEGIEEQKPTKGGELRSLIEMIKQGIECEDYGKTLDLDLVLIRVEAIERDCVVIRKKDLVDFRHVLREEQNELSLKDDDLPNWSYKEGQIDFIDDRLDGKRLLGQNKKVSE